MARVAVVGAGPAGCVFAARMAQLGHDVRLIEQANFPRNRLGESLTPGVAPLLKSAKLEAALDANCLRVRGVRVDWADGPRWREDPHEQGRIVDRGAFDFALVERVRAFGVEVRQPAKVVDRRRDGRRWRLTIEANGGAETLEADFLAEASGRGGASADRKRTGAPTLAVFAYWRAANLPEAPRIEAAEEAWFWGVPLPNALYNTLAFVDPKAFRSTPGALVKRFRAALAGSSLLDDCLEPELVSDIRAVDATPYLAADSVAADAIRLGDAALAIDPISSSGVQKAIQSALSGAIVANTLLRKPEATDIAMRFYRGHLSDASERHRLWAAGHYGAVAARFGGLFWSERSKDGEPPPQMRPAGPADARAMAAMPVEMSQEASLVETPCLGEEFVTVADALSHPGLAGPVAYLGGFALAPLLRSLQPGRTPLEIARSWQVPLESGLAIAGWLVSHGILVNAADRNAGPMAQSVEAP